MAINYMDWAIILILGWGMFQGYRAGVIRVIGGLAAYGISLIASFRYSPALLNWVNERWMVTEYLQEYLAKRLILVVPTAATMPAPGELGSEKWLSQLGFPEMLTRQLGIYWNEMAAAGQAGVTNLLDALSQLMAQTIVRGAAMILLFVSVLIVMRWVLVLLSGVLNHGFLGNINRLTGSFLGLGFHWLLLTGVAGLVIMPIATLGVINSTKTGMWDQVNQIISGSQVLPYLSIFFNYLVTVLGTGWGV